LIFKWGNWSEKSSYHSKHETFSISILTSKQMYNTSPALESINNNVVFSTIKILYSLIILIILIPNPSYGIRKIFLMRRKKHGLHYVSHIHTATHPAITFREKLVSTTIWYLWWTKWQEGDRFAHIWTNLNTKASYLNYDIASILLYTTNTFFSPTVFN